MHDTARVHGTAVVALLVLTVALVWWLQGSGAAPAVQRRSRLFVEVLAAQAAVGYVQYFTRIPAALVAVHIGGAAAAWSAALWLCCGLTRAEPAGHGAEDGATTGPVTARAGVLSRV